MRGEEWFRIADLRHVWIVVDVPGAEVAHVRPGQPVRVHLPDLGQSIVARVSDAAPRFDAETRTFKLRLDADNPGERLRPDMLADVDLPVPFSAALAVPSDAVVDTGLSQVVYVEQAPGEFQRREVVTGWRRGDRVQVLGGLAAGDRVVTSGTFLLESESRMRKGAVRAAAPTPAATAHASGER
jgi:RND family efflux transporter MFP subunit